MNPAKEKYYRGLFLTAAGYDVLLGILFTFFPKRAFAMLGITDRLPAFEGYLTLLGAFVLVIGIAYYLIARGDLRRNIDLVLVGGLYKLAYCTIALYYWFAGELPHPIFGALFGVVDLVFLLLMAECYVCLRKATRN